MDRKLQLTQNAVAHIVAGMQQFSRTAALPTALAARLFLGKNQDAGVNFLWPGTGVLLGSSASIYCYLSC